MQTIDQGLEEFMQAAFTPAALEAMHELQREQCRELFFAGVRWLSSELDRSTDEGLMLENIERQLRDFISAYEIKHGL